MTAEAAKNSACFKGMFMLSLLHSRPQKCIRKAIVSVLIISGLAALFVAKAQRSIRAGVGARLSAPPSRADYAHLPVFFERNDGQTDSKVRFLSHGPGYELFLTSNEAVLALRKVLDDNQPQPSPGTRSGHRPIRFMTASLWINLAGANSNPTVEGIDPLPGRVNYLIGNDQDQWHRDIPTYARVRYRSVYPGIDLIYYGSPQALEYDLVAAPGANPNAVRIALQGADKTRFDSAGNLVISTAAGDLTMRKPRVYQQDTDGERRIVDARYAMDSGASHTGLRTVAVQVAAYDRRLPLVIDPELVYSSYLGGFGDRSGDPQGFPILPPGTPNGTLPPFSDAAIDLDLGPRNTVFIAGLAYSSKFPTTHGVLQPADRSSSTTPNGFVAKFDATKIGPASLVYSTYLGGRGCDTAPCAPGHDGDQANGVAVDGSGDAYVAGLTYSLDFPNAGLCGLFGLGLVQEGGLGDKNNGFVAELKPAGNALVYSCFIHGRKGAPVSGIAIRPGCKTPGKSGCEAYVVGNTTSNSTTDEFPIVNGYQTSNPDKTGNSSGYVTVVAPNGKSLIYSTFLGGSSNPAANGGRGAGEALTRIAVSSCPATKKACPAYVTGGSFSPDYPRVKAFQSTNKAAAAANNVEDAVVSEINPLLSGKSSLVYSTFLGGSGVTISVFGFTVAAFGDIGVGIALDASNNVYVTGGTASRDFPLSKIKKPFSTAKGSTYNAFATELAPSQTPTKQLIYSTYFGGNGSGFLVQGFVPVGDIATDITLDSKGNIYLAGLTTSTNLPIDKAAPCKALQKLNGSSDAIDGFVSELNPNLGSKGLGFSVYLGGSNKDASTSIKRDTSGKLYVAGGTFSKDFPITIARAAQKVNNAFAKGTTNAFVTVLDPSGTTCTDPTPTASKKAIATATRE
jgi:hypothetical protein